MYLTLSWRRSLSYRNQSIVLQSKSMDWFLYDRDLHQENVNKNLLNISNGENPIIYVWQAFKYASEHPSQMKSNHLLFLSQCFLSLLFTKSSQVSMEVSAGNMENYLLGHYFISGLRRMPLYCLIGYTVRKNVIIILDIGNIQPHIKTFTSILSKISLQKYRVAAYTTNGFNQSFYKFSSRECTIKSLKAYLR